MGFLVHPADLVFDPTLANRRVCSSQLRPTRPLSPAKGRLVLLLERAMLAGLCPVYVDRFARVWHRLSTTDPNATNAIIVCVSLNNKYNFCFCPIFYRFFLEIIHFASLQACFFHLRSLFLQPLHKLIPSLAVSFYAIPNKSGFRVYAYAIGAKIACDFIIHWV